MVHRIRHLLFCVLATATAVVLAGASLTIDSRAVPRTDAHSIQVVREYYSALNEYIRTGQQDLMSPFLQHLLEEGWKWMPRPTEDLSSTVELAARRASYPDLRYRIVAVDSAGDAVVARVAADPGNEILPAWVDSSIAVTSSIAPVYFRIGDRRIVDNTASSGSLTSFLNMVQPDTLFRMETPARITIAQLSFSATEASQQLVPLPGPGVFIVQSGSVSVIGNGLAEIANPRTADRTLVPVGAEHVANPGDAIIVPLGKTVVRVKSNSQTTVMAALAVPIESEPDRHVEREKVDRTRMGVGLLDSLRELPHGVQPIWFGTAEVLSDESQLTNAGWFPLEAGWLVVPPGGRVALDLNEGQLALHTGTHGMVIDRTHSQDVATITNLGQAPAMVFIARVSEDEGLL